MYTFHVADDHPIFCSAISTVIEQTFVGSEVSHSLSLDAALEYLGENEVDLLLLDLNMPGSQDLLGLMSVRERYPSLPVAIISASTQTSLMQKALLYGASAFIPKSCAQTEISEALQAVLEGEQWLPKNARDLPPLRDEERDLAEKLAALTSQQKRVLQFLKEGLLNKQIAAELGVTEATVKAHISAIFRALGVSNRTQVVVLLASLNTDS